MSTKGKMVLNTNNEQITKFVNYVMKDGKKTLALKLLSKAFAIMKDRGQKKPEDTFNRAISNVMPKIEVRPKRV